MAGLDIGHAGRVRRAEADPNYRMLPIADKLVEMGRLGQKTVRGWFKYEKGDRTPHPDPVVADLIRTMSAEMGNTPRDFTEDEILKRLLFSSVNEACKILEEKIAYRASDVDVMWLYGFGFPRYHGGLMYLGRQYRHPRRLQPNRRLAPTIRRPLGPLRAATEAGGYGYGVPGSAYVGRLEE